MNLIFTLDYKNHRRKLNAIFWDSTYEGRDDQNFQKWEMFFFKIVFYV